MHTMHSHQITFTAKTLFTGALIAYFLAVAGAATWYGVTQASGNPLVWFSNFFLSAFWGLPLAALGYVMAYGLGVLLRPVVWQWVHVAAFFCLFAAATWGTMLMVGVGTGDASWLGIGAGAVAAIGRASVCHLVTTREPEPALDPS